MGFAFGGLGMKFMMASARSDVRRQNSQGTGSSGPALAATVSGGVFFFSAVRGRFVAGFQRRT